METNDDSDIIFTFFQQLTDGKLQSKDMRMSFGIYYSQERRRKILEAIGVPGIKNVKT